MFNFRAQNKYLLVIKTDKYAGNFERELTAYCTGVIGDCEVGDEEAGKFHDEVDEKYHDLFYDYVGSEPDDHGCYRPCDLDELDTTTPTQSFVIFFCAKPTIEMENIMKERIEDFCANHKDFSGNPDPIKVLGYEFRTYTSTMSTQQNYNLGGNLINE